jgi:uncharacterized protein (DUF736 family)
METTHMLNIGTLKRVATTGTRKFEGPVNLGRRLNGTLFLDDNPRWTQSAENIPRYVVRYLPTGWRGAEMRVGSAWEMHSDRSNVDYLSLKLEDPDWSSPLSLTAFASEEEKGGLDIVWSAPQRKEQQQAA